MSITALQRALAVVQIDVVMLKSVVIDMQYGNPTIEESAPEKFLVATKLVDQLVLTCAD